MKQRVRHAASTRQVADPIIAEVELRDGTRGYGETLPRPYVTGEDGDSVRRTLVEILIPRILTLSPQTFAEALAIIEDLPCVDSQGRFLTAARCAVELALLDAYSRHFQRPILPEVVNWLGLYDFQPPGCLAKVRCSGVLTAESAHQVRRQLLKMRCYGLKNFKMKVGTPADNEVMALVLRKLHAGLCRNRITLRLDANGAWDLEKATQALQRWPGALIHSIEQPLPRGFEAELPQLREKSGWRIMHDESLVTLEDARRLEALQVADAYNIRISKCGGLLPSLKLLAHARQNNIQVMLGCMVGQTSLLSAVERQLLAHLPAVDFVESNFGRFLLQGDIVHPALQFGWGGRLQPGHGLAWGVQIDPRALKKYSTGESTRIVF